MSAVEQARERLMRQVREYGILCVDTYRGLTLNNNPLKSQAMAGLSERLDAYAAAVRAERDAAWREGVDGLTRYRGIKQSIQRNGDMVRWTWPADEKKHRYCANVLDRNDVLALAARMEAK